MNSLFRSDLATLKASEVSVPLRKHMMCLNESCLDPYQAILSSFHKRMQSVHLNRYLSGLTLELKTRLCQYAGHGLGIDNLLMANGADDILYHLFLAVRENEQSYALSLAPSYFDYKTFALAVGLKIRFLDLNPDFSFDPLAFIRKASDPNCRLAILCNPNNPTGNLYTKDQLRQIVEALPDKPVLIDETYFEFSECTFADELALHPNLILVRSFSKAFSAAGLRFGYAISNEANILELKKVFTTFPQSILAQAFALSILDNADIFLAQVQEVKRLRDALYQRMTALPGLTVYPSATNFLTFTIGERSAELFAYLKDRDVALRDVGAHPRLQYCLRVSISCNDDVQAFEQGLLAFLAD